jgi:hypothetical protein
VFIVAVRCQSFVVRMKLCTSKFMAKNNISLPENEVTAGQILVTEIQPEFLYVHI